MAEIHKVSYRVDEQDLKKHVEENRPIAGFYKKLAKDYFDGKLVYKQKKK